MSVNKKMLSSIGDRVSNIYAGALETSTPFIAVCDMMKKAYKGEEVPEADMDYIATRVASQRNWTPQATKVRTSEIKTILNQYAHAGEAITKAVKLNKGNKMPFSHCLKIARALKKGDSITKAAKANDKVDAVKPNKRTKAVATKSVKVHIKRILEHTQMPKAFRDELKALAENYNLD